MLAGTRLPLTVVPKVIETPIFQGVAQNGIQLNVKARVTVRSNLDRYVGGAGEQTIIARVGEGVDADHGRPVHPVRGPGAGHLVFARSTVRRMVQA